MSPFFCDRWRGHALASVLAAASLLFSLAASAGPGAHGPNGEHLDTPATAAAAGTNPRMEAKSELFELVANLYEGELSILIDRFETNEPVLGAAVEVELGHLKAKARFHADHGDYAVDDPALLKALAQPGEHALVYTIVAGEDSDLLEGSLRVSDAATAEAHGHAQLPKALWIGLLVPVLLVGAVWYRRRRRQRFVNALRGRI